MSLRLLALMWLCLGTPVWAAGQATENCTADRLLFTMIPKKDMDEQLVEYQPLIALLREGLGMQVEVLRSSSYESAVDALVSGAVDVAVLGPAAYIMARSRDAGIEPFASLAVQPGSYTPAGSFYYSLLLVNADSPSRQPADLQGARVALTDPASTSGALIPKTEFSDVVNRSLPAFFGGQLYAGGHDKAMDALIADDVDAAFVSSSRVDEYVSRGVIGEDGFRVIWRSSPLHYDPFVFRSGLCDSLKRKIETLMTTPSQQRRDFLDSQQATDITRVDHSDYRPLERLVD
ncbi:phosphate/phosphite/phosphonate ABC transporter substrate-binding protein [Marinobacter nauticus]